MVIRKVRRLLNTSTHCAATPRTATWHPLKPTSRSTWFFHGSRGSRPLEAENGGTYCFYIYPNVGVYTEKSGSSKSCVLSIPFDANMTLWALHQGKRQHRTSNVQHRTSKVVKIRFFFSKKQKMCFRCSSLIFLIISIVLVVAVNIPI